MRILLLFIAALISSFGLAGVQATAGPYRIELTSEPQVVPAKGSAKLMLRITDEAGTAQDGLEVRAIARMPGMPMGERESRALSVSGQPGTYSVQANFPMAGGYEVAMSISGGKGLASVVIPIQTGQDTGGQSAGFSWVSLLPWVFGAVLIAFVIYRMKRTGQRLNWSGVFNTGTIGGVVLLIVMFLLARYAVTNMRRAGSMTPIEAQVMEMNTPPPPGSTPVTLATVKRGPISEVVTYTGQVVGFIEQDVVPRVTGTIVSMPVYVGDRVKKGQVLARLDTSQLDPQVAERIAMMGMAAKGVDVAAAEYGAALAEVAEARAELGVKESMVAEAEAMLSAARQDKQAMEADISAVEAEARFRRDELGRMRSLFEQKAISRSELQQAESEAADAQSKVNAARANVRKADAMVLAAQKKVRQAQADVRAAQAGIRAREAAAGAKQKGIAKEQAGVAQARAGLQGAAAQRGYSVLKAEVDGVVTQRLISPGVVVAPGQAVLKVAQISPIRLQANVAESDLARIRVGTAVTISPPLSPMNGGERGQGVRGPEVRTRVTSIQPGVDPRARTGVVEVVWPNANGRFLPGQFVSMRIEIGGSRGALVVPVDSVQRPPASDGQEKAFVWVASPSGDQFTVARTEVLLGVSDGTSVQVLSGLREGQMVVMTGAMNLREGATVASSLPPASQGILGEGERVVEVTAAGFSPSMITAERGKALSITFIRRIEETCGTEVVFPDLGINKPLPLNRPVKVTLTPAKSGDIRFACGMDMLRGKVVVR